MSAATPERLGARWLLGAAALYAIATVVFTYPAVSDLGGTLIGGPRDGPMFLWNTWWAPHAVLELGTSPLGTQHLFHPPGTSLALHTHTVLPALLTAPLQPLAGLVAAYDLAVLATFVLSGIGALLLAWEVTRSRPAALVAGAMFAFCHHRVSGVMFFNLVQSQWLALYLWALWRTWARSSLGAAAAAVLFGVALAYSSHTLFVFAALVSALVVPAALLAARRDRARCVRFAAHAGLVAGGVLAGALPLLLAIRSELAAEGSYVTRAGSTAYLETTRLSELLLRSPLAADGDLIRQAGYLGTPALLLGLAALALARRRRALWFWAAVSAAFLTLSLGPVLDVRGLPFGDPTARPLPLPYRWLQDVPVLRELRVAHRFGIPGALALTVVAALGLAALVERLRRRFEPRPAAVATAAVVLSAVVVLDLLQLPFPKLYRLPPVPDELHVVAEDTRPCSVLEFPAGRSGYPAFSHLQTVHEKPVYLDGELARTPPRLRALREESPLLSALERAFRGHDWSDAELAALAPRLSAEAAAGAVGWVVLAWADADVFMKRRSAPNPDGLRALDRLVRATLPVRRTVLAAEPGAAEAWHRTPGRKSLSCLYRIYELELP